MKNSLIFVFLITVLLVFACKTSQITSTWKKSDASSLSFHKIMIFGIINDKNRTIREQMEEHLVGDLKDLGFNAYSSYDVYGPKSFDKLSEDQVYSLLKKDSVDAVITIVLLDKEREKYYVPGRVIYTPYVGFYNRFWHYYTTIYQRIESPGYFTSSTKYFWESNMYDLSNNELLYSVQTQTFDPASVENMSHEYGKLIVKNIVQSNIISVPPKGTLKAM